MPYHMRITIKSNKTDDVVCLDLSEDKLNERILNPYNQGLERGMNGNTLSAYVIGQIQMNFTEKDPNIVNLNIIQCPLKMN